MLNEETAKKLAKIAGELQASENKYQIGVGTVAARLVESLVSHPEIMETLLSERAPQIAAESRAEYETAPKARTGQRGKKQAAK